MKPQRVKMPDTRTGLTRKDACGGAEYYVTVSFYPDGDREGMPGEVFVRIAKEGSTLGGMFDALSTTISLALQYGVPWPTLRDHYMNMQFDPRGSSLDGSREYPSIVHAVACTIDGVISHHKSIWDDIRKPEGSGQVSPAETVVASGDREAASLTQPATRNDQDQTSNPNTAAPAGGNTPSLADANVAASKAETKETEKPAKASPTVGYGRGGMVVDPEIFPETTDPKAYQPQVGGKPVTYPYEKPQQETSGG